MDFKSRFNKNQFITPSTCGIGRELNMCTSYGSDI